MVSPRVDHEVEGAIGLNERIRHLRGVLKMDVIV